MKYLIITVITIVACFIAYEFYKNLTLKPATEQQLEDVRKELACKIDSVKQQIIMLDIKLDKKTDSIIRLCNTSSDNIDTLKIGQAIIYNEVKRSSEKNFWVELRNYFK